MKISLFAVLICATTLLNAQAVKNAPRIYVQELHVNAHPDWDAVLQSKLISALVQECGSNCTVVDAAGATGENGDDFADVILTGAGFVDDAHHYRIQAAMRLVNKEGAVIWADTIYSSPFARSATSSFASNTAKRVASFLAQSRGK